jgi:hypothetical protein
MFPLEQFQMSSKGSTRFESMPCPTAAAAQSSQESRHESNHQKIPTIKKVRVVVSSADRNLSTYPNPADYLVKFDEPFVDVVSMALVSANVPLVAPDVSLLNNRLDFAVTLPTPGNSTEVTYTKRLPPGDVVNGDALAALVADAMNSATAGDGDFEFRVQYVQRTDGFVIKSLAGVQFRLIFFGGTQPYGPQSVDEFGQLTPQGLVEQVGVAGERSTTYSANCCARLLGFGPFNYASVLNSQDNSQEVKSAFRKDWTSHKDTVVLSIDGADVNVSVNNTLNRSFAVLGPRCLEFELQNQDLAVKNYNPPVGKLAKLRVRLMDLNGNLYDFQNRDHRLVFVLHCMPRYQSRPNWTVRAD